MDAGPAHPSHGSRIGAALCLGGAVLLLCAPPANTDVFWHLKAGEWIAGNLRVPAADWLSSTLAGSPWSDFEWLTQLLWHAVYAAAGFPGLRVLKAAVLCGAAAVLWRTLGLAGAGPLARGTGVLAWALAAALANDLRPENFSVLFLLALWHQLEARRRGAAWPGFAGRWGRPAAAFALFALWANLHAGFIYGLVLLGIFAAAEAARRRSPGPLAPLAAAALGTLVNPFGTGVYTVPASHWADIGTLSRSLVEWGPPDLSSPEHWPFAALFAAALAVAAARQAKRGDLPAEHALALAFFGASALRLARTEVYFASVALPVLAAALKDFPGPGPLRAAAPAAAAALAGLLLLRHGPRLVDPRPFDPRYLPVRTADYLDAHRPALGGLKLYNPWHWGGYLGWRLSPDYKVFVDGRYIFHRFLEPMREAKAAPESFGAFLDAHRIDLVLMGRTRAFFPDPVPLKSGESLTVLRPRTYALLPAENWALVHWNPSGLVFLRKGAADPVWLAANEYKTFRLDDLRAAEILVNEGAVSLDAVAGEVARFVAETRAADPASADGAKAWLALIGGGPRQP